MIAGHVIDALREGDVRAVASVDGPTRMEEEHVRAEVARPWSRGWVARQDDEVVAYLLTWHVADELHVLNLATRPDRRRQGIARSLMNRAVQYARDNAIRLILLEVRRTNESAISLYRSLGFFASGLRARYYGDDEDAVEMALALDPASGQIIRRVDDVRL